VRHGKTEVSLDKSLVRKLWLHHSNNLTMDKSKKTNLSGLYDRPEKRITRAKTG